VNPRLKFALLSALIGPASFCVTSFFCAAIINAATGSGPHGDGRLIFAVLPMMLTPIGLGAGIVLGLVIKSRSYALLMIGLGATFVMSVLGYGLLLLVTR
jgi:hypothetical protein